MRPNRLGRGLVDTGLAVVAAVMISSVPVGTALAADPPPQSGSIGLEGTISSAPPKHGATIAVPSNGAVFTSVPITVSGLCPSDVLVKIFSNGIFIGSTVCSHGSYSLKVDLLSGRNDLVARVYDALDQAGPDSNIVTVTFNDAQFLKSGTPLSLTSAYGERGAPPGTVLEWPVVINGGTAPYAISTDWGDGSPADLMSSETAGTITLKHTYKTAGIYRVIIKATDKNGDQAFLQVIGQATGAVQNNKKGDNTIVKTKVIWWPAFAMVPLIFAAFWLGGRHRVDVLNREFDEQ